MTSLLIFISTSRKVLNMKKCIGNLNKKFTDTKVFKIFKTRWLSLDKTVKKVLIQWDALCAYFDRESEDDKSAQVSRLKGHFNSILVKLLLFLDYALDSLCKFDATFRLIFLCCQDYKRKWITRLL